MYYTVTVLARPTEEHDVQQSDGLLQRVGDLPCQVTDLHATCVHAHVDTVQRICMTVVSKCCVRHE